MNRAEARTFLMESLFEMELNKELKKSNLDKYLSRKNCKTQEQYIYQVFEYVCDNVESIDKTINSVSNKWKTTRMPKIDLTILRIAIAETSIQDRVNKAIAINEAVKLAKKYSGENSPKFINGILGNVIHE